MQSKYQLKTPKTEQEFLDYYKLKTTLWITGGWVWDKLLNIDTDDIDIISDNYFGDFISTRFY